MHQGAGDMSKRGAVTYSACSRVIKSDSMKHLADLSPASPLSPHPNNNKVVLYTVKYSYPRKASCDTCRIVSLGAVMNEIY